jgi:hypothetical protein
MAPVPSELRTFYDGWANHRRLIVDAIRDLTPDRLALTGGGRVVHLAARGPCPGVAATGSRAFLGEGDPALRGLGFPCQATGLTS